MKLLFTNGITGFVKNGVIHIDSFGNLNNTGLSFMNDEIEYEVSSILYIENTYGVRLISLTVDDFFEEEYGITCVENGIVRELTHDFSYESVRIRLYDYILKAVFNDVDKYYSQIGAFPIFIATEGIKQELYMSKTDFQNAVIESDLYQNLIEEDRYRLMYLHDLQSILDDLTSTFLTIEHHFIYASIELNKLANGMIRDYSKSADDFEYGLHYQMKYLSGMKADIVYSHFMNVIFRITSTLDIVTKLAFEISNMPIKYDKFIKFSSNGKYYNDLKKLKSTFEKYTNFKGSLLDNEVDFQEIVNIRNSIAHNMFITSSPQINYTLTKDEKMGSTVLYSSVFLWDIDEKGIAERWSNRSRFYSNQTCMQKYLLDQIVTFNDSFYKTLALFSEILCELKR